MTAITAPGVYDLDEATYHADPIPTGSLSVTGAKKLLPPSVPALYKWERDNPRPPKKEFDFGHAAHARVLGRGLGIDVHDYPDWRTNKAKAAATESRDAGRVPLLPDAWQVVCDMADAIRAHPIAGPLFDPDHGKPEQSAFWQDPATGVWCRARWDWLPEPTTRRKLVIPDYKTTVAADNTSAAKTIGNLRYFMQDAWYTEGARAVNLHDDFEFVFVMQEKTAPYLVNVVRVDTEARQLGARMSQQALTTYLQCATSGVWPGYSTDTIPTLSLPTWTARELEYA